MLLRHLPLYEVEVAINKTKTKGSNPAYYHIQPPQKSNEERSNYNIVN